jgi:hypothetical protein
MKLRTRYKSILRIVALVLTAAMLFAADNVSTYLILNDIPPYVRLTKTRDIVTDQSKTIPGYTIYSSPGILAGADHFLYDHPDMTYETKYQSEELDMGMSVQVTQHAGADSDKWLLHEVEDSYRSDDLSRLGLLSKGTILKTLGGSRYFSIRLGGGSYMWLSNNVVIRISYRNLQGGKPEPLEVIQAYIQKFPSTIPSTLTLDKAHDEKWIKDEMDRRLWLCDKWFMQLQLKKVEERQVYQESVKSMNIFLDYREKYYGIKAADEKNLLAGYLNANNGTGIKAKLKEYKDWWVVNKEKAINL